MSTAPKKDDGAQLIVTESGRRRPEYTLQSDINGEVTLKDFLEYTKQSLILIADNALTEERAKGFDKDPIVVIDGKANANPASVHPLGQIEFVSRVSMEQILLETYQGILTRSPIDTGRYVNSHYVFLNGTQVATSYETLRTWIRSNPEFQEKDLIRFVNIQPYARKLERHGITSSTAVVRSRSVKKTDKRSGQTKVLALQPNGAYFLTTRSIRSKYKRNSVIKFSFISGASLGISGSFKNSRGGKPGRIGKT